MSCMTSVTVDACSIARAGLYGYFTAMPKNNAMRNDRAETLSEIATLFFVTTSTRIFSFASDARSDRIVDARSDDKNFQTRFISADVMVKG